MLLPSVLCLSGFDPSGGAGMQADIEACAANGAHTLGVVTALTAQNTRNVFAIEPVGVEFMRRQLDALLEDCRPAAVKIGLIGSAAQLPVILDVISELGVPVVCDPVLRASGGATLLTPDIAVQLVADLFPHASLVTPNAAEARQLAPGSPTLRAAAQALCNHGCAAALVTGGDEQGGEAEDILYTRQGNYRTWRSTRIAGGFHGAGCTLSSAIAARLAQGDALEVAIEHARKYVHTALATAFSVGRGRAIPRRRA